MQILFCHLNALGIEIEALCRNWFVSTEGNLADLKAIEQPFPIEMCELDSGHQPVASEIVDSVRVKLTRDNGRVDILGFFFLQHGADVLRQTLVYIPQNAVDLSIALDDLRTPIFVPLVQPLVMRYMLEHMAEWTVTDVVKQCRK